MMRLRKNDLERGDGLSVASLVVRVVVVAVLLACVGGMAYLRTFPPMATVMSESMSPRIGVGDIVLFKSTQGTTPKVGDIVEINVPAAYREKFNYPRNVIHRVTGFNENGTFTTKGDNLSTADPFEVTSSMVNREVVFTVPVAGRLLGFVFSPFGLLWLAIGLLIFVVMPFYDVQKERAELHHIELSALDQMRSKLERIEDEALRGPPMGTGAYVDLTDIPVQTDPEVNETLKELVSAVGEYGHHLRSHTAVLQSMSAASQDLAGVVAQLKAQMDAGTTAAAPAAPSATAPAPTGAAALPPHAGDVLAWLQSKSYAEWSLVAPSGAAGELGLSADDVAGTVVLLGEAGLLELDPVSPPDLYRYRLA